MTGSDLFRPELWSLDPDVVHLNHGSFGACPDLVLGYQSQLRQQMERNTLRFFESDLPDLLDDARDVLGSFLGANPSNLVFLSNATTAVSTVLASLDFTSPDRILVTDHGYNACTNAARYFANKSGIDVDVVGLPFPLDDADDLIDRVLEACTEQTRLLLIDHVTSPTGIILPLERLLPLVRQRGIQVLIDGAHAPGMLPLKLEQLGVDFYTGNCHKWMCSPKGTAFLYVSPEHQQVLRPLTISHGMNRPLGGSSRFRLEFDWTGTRDPTGFLTIPVLIDHLGSLSAGGWSEVMARNRGLVIQARDMICAALNLEPPCPNEMLGALATVILPDVYGVTGSNSDNPDPLKEVLRRDYGIEVSLAAWPSPAGRFLRVSAQLYNSKEQYEQLANALVDELRNSG